MVKVGVIMKKNKILWITIASTLVIAIGIVVYLFVTKEDKVSTLNILEKQWIESNKNQRFDFSVISDIPIFSYDGEGIFLDFLDNVEEVTGLEFNRISVNLGDESTTDYGFKIVDEVGEDDILVYEDDYVIVSNLGVRYEDISQLDNVLLGALNREVSQVSYYLNGANVSFKTCDEVEGLFAGIQNDPENNIVPLVDAIVLPKTLYLDEVLKYKDYNVTYTVTDMSKKIVLTLGDNEHLNNILTKYYEKWSEENFVKEYNDYLLKLYFKVNEINEQHKAKFTSKQYVYGFVDNAPFDMVDNGINYNIINSFKDFAGVDIVFEKYNSYDNLIDAFNENKIDFMFNNFGETSYNIDILKTVSNYDESFVVMAKNDSNLVVNSVNSLANKDIHVLADNKIEAYFNTQEFNVEGHKNIEHLVSNIDNDDLIVIDYYTYKYYLDSYLKNYDVKYIFNLDDDYNFIVRDIIDNTDFYNLFNFYLSLLNDKRMVNANYNLSITEPINTFNYRIIILIGLIIIVLIVILIILLCLKKKKISSNFSKDDKIKYIDLLTSLKNRNYLNENIEKWDASEVYPQTIIIADLNNVTYVNDNYGHNEGDNLIKEAANILIKNQIANSEIIRTNGNEFLIYLVGYEEKQIISFIRKLNKEFKELAHGFGVALGYSMINDAIKTIDDAINEATLEMRNNKEEANN